MTTTPPSAWQIEQAMSALQRAQAADPDPGGIGEIVDTLVSAQTDVRDIVERLIRASLEAEMMDEALDQYIAQLRARQHRWVNLCDRTRAVATEILEILGWPTPLRYPDFTLSKSTAGPAVQVTDPDLLPDEFCKILRQPMRGAIRAAIDAGHTVPGAELGNTRTTLRVTRT